MNNYKLALLIISYILFSTAFPVKAQEKITLNYADSLIGKNINGVQVREAIGNVSLSQGSVKIYCNRVIQYFDQNKAELYGNVKVIKDTLTIYAPSGIYYGDEGKVICPNGATLNDSKVTLKANYGTYYFANDQANFKGNVKIYDDKSYTIASDELIYYRSVEKSFASGNVKIVTDSSIIYSDNLIYEKLIGIANATGNVRIESDSTIITSNKATYFETEKKSIAEEKVKIEFINNNATIWGNYGENFERRNYSFVKGNSRLVQMDRNKNGTDTLYIWSEIMEAYRNIPEYYVATDSVKIIRGDFSSVSQMGYYYKNLDRAGGKIILDKDPVVWKEDFQISADSIYADVEEDIEDIFAYKSAFALRSNEKFPERYDQISGIFMHMKFDNKEINYIRVDTNSTSIYFVIEDNRLNGVNKIESHTIILYFNNKTVEKVKSIGNPNGSYTPEKLLDNSSLRLPGFRIRTNKPNLN